ncbi:MAG TPA: acyl-CoA dehydrogenase [Spirochaetes bacterium]|nr:acyl-CoA dehydrogenase [Spirochaetota bacterium]
MELPLTQEQLMIKEMIREFARSEIEPCAQDYNERGEFPAGIIGKLGKLGLFGMMVPEEYGGSGAGAVSYSLALQELAAACASVAVTISVTNLSGEPILNFGTEEQKRRFLMPMASGEYIGAFALTEPEAGSDPSGIRTTAVRKGGRFILNGTKQFITNGGYAGLFVCIARTSPGKGGLSAFIVPAGSKGLVIGKTERKMGLSASNTVEILLEDCEIPDNLMLGKEGQGLRTALGALSSGRIGIASQATGMIAACLREGVAYARERKQFGRPIIRHQTIQNMIADMAVDYESSVLMTWNAARLKDAGGDYALQASMAKLHASESLIQCAYRALQIFGGYGYIKDNKIERIYRDARVTTIYEGTSEVQRMIISRDMEGLI